MKKIAKVALGAGIGIIVGTTIICIVKSLKKRCEELDYEMYKDDNEDEEEDEFEEKWEDLEDEKSDEPEYITIPLNDEETLKPVEK